MRNIGLLVSLTFKSLWNRKFSVGLTITSISISVLLLLAVETVRTETRNSFISTISSTDLIVGARSGSVQLLLYSVFRIGNATNNISWDSYQKISQHSSVAWAIPISLGDSHRGFRVMGTNTDYFDHYRYGSKLPLAFSEGNRFDTVFDTVLGAQVAKELGYQLGDQIEIAHGVTDTHFARHDDKPFTVVGILQPTGTPVDRTVHVSLEGIEAIHVDWQGGTRSHKRVTAEEAAAIDLEPEQITAFMLGLNSKMAVFKLQRAINEYKGEPLLAILPGIALGELWQLVGVAETALLLVSLFVLVNSLIGLLTVVLTSLNERRREIAILRSLGCGPGQVFTLLTLESMVLTLLSCVAAVAVYYTGVWVAQPILQQQLGMAIPFTWLNQYQWTILAAVTVVSGIVGSVPGYRAYRYSLADGMSIKL